MPSFDITFKVDYTDEESVMRAISSTMPYLLTKLSGEARTFEEIFKIYFVLRVLDDGDLVQEPFAVSGSSIRESEPGPRDISQDEG